MTQEEKRKIHKELELEWLKSFIELNLEAFDDVELTDDEFDKLVERLMEAYYDNDDIVMIINDLAVEVVKDFIIND